MVKIAKELKKFNEEERQEIKVIVEKLIKRDFQGLKIKKLKGYSNIFRAKKNKIRIIYQISNEGKVIILKINRRSENTYKIL